MATTQVLPAATSVAVVTAPVRLNEIVAYIETTVRQGEAAAIAAGDQPDSEAWLEASGLDADFVEFMRRVGTIPTEVGDCSYLEFRNPTKPELPPHGALIVDRTSATQQ